MSCERQEHLPIPGLGFSLITLIGARRSHGICHTQMARRSTKQGHTAHRTVSLQSHSLNAKRNRERTVHANVSESCACAWLLVPRGWVLRCVVVVVGWLARWEGGCAPSGVRPLRAARPNARPCQRRGRKALRRWRRRRPRGVAAPGPRRPSPLRCACRPRGARWPSPPRPSSTRPWPRAPSRARRAPPTTAARA